MYRSQDTNLKTPSQGQTTLALWGGIEGTVNRVGDIYHDQNERSGHARRVTDLDLVATLGVEALRYPVLWERTAPDGLENADWSWLDERLGRLRSLNIRPIAGLVHHGSGPRDTSLVDPQFPQKLAAYAGAVAARYPWLDTYTPVNEPLTTARFSGLYGLWYPHGRDGQTLLRALLTECRGTVEAMRAIRRINPAAQLVQTDDLGKTYGTPAMAEQAALDNERRWLTFDLLCGRVGRGHPLWEQIRRTGIAEHEILWFQDNPLPPDVLGINYYVTGERFLDERVERYAGRSLTESPWPEQDPGRVFADIEAVRIYAQGLAGPGVLLREAWERYGLPPAVTEVHLACTREEQMRRLWEVWGEAQSLNRTGVDVRAVTCWSLFGAFDWGNLVQHAWGDYEPGVFDLRAPEPRPTALAAMMRDLAAGRVPDQPALAVPGWWRRADRFEYPPEPGADSPHTDAPDTLAWQDSEVAPVMIVGADTRFGAACARQCTVRGLPCRALTAEEVDAADPASVGAALRRYAPWAVVSALDRNWKDRAGAEASGRHDPVIGPAVLAAACAHSHIPFLMFSSDAVFDGTKEDPYLEDDPVSPRSDRGTIQAAAEAAVREACPDALILRVGAPFDPSDSQDWVVQALAALAAGQAVMADNTVVISPASLRDVVNASLDLLLDGERGVWHLSSHGAMTEEEVTTPLC